MPFSNELRRPITFLRIIACIGNNPYFSCCHKLIFLPIVWYTVSARRKNSDVSFGCRNSKKVEYIGT